MSIQQMPQEGSPPFVQFEQRAVEDRDETIKQGHLVHKDVDFALVRVAGSKDTFEQEAAIWLKQCEDLATKRPPRYPPHWARGHRDHYNNWKQGIETPQQGFALRDWGSITEAQRKNCFTAGVFTVEGLAASNEETLTRIGMGARVLKQKAQAWVDANTGNVVEELHALRSEVGNLRAVNEDLTKQRAAQEARLTALEATVNSADVSKSKANKT